MADLRDDKVVRASYLSQLIDIDGSDLQKVYEPVSHQIGYVVSFCLFLMMCHFAWKRYKKWKEERTPQFIPYKVLKPPSSMIMEEQEAGGKGEGGKKRVCAVVGGTGFIGGHVVDELVARKKYHVFVLGRKFNPERTNPGADCIIQVDMLDEDGLVHAFQGVDSVINAAAVIPNVFHTADSIYSKNRTAFNNVLKAAKKAGVKNLLHLSGFPMKTRPKDPVFAAFLNVFESAEKDIVAANGEDGLQTCVFAPTNILGLNSAYLDQLLSGKMKSSPMPDRMPNSFMPVEYLVAAMVNAEEKLANPATANCIAGKLFLLRGEPMSWKTLYSLPGWPQKISEVSPITMAVVVKINTICATLFGQAPFGAELSTGMLDFLMESSEADVAEEEVQEAYRVLGVGPPHPPIVEYLPQLVKKYKAKMEKMEKKNQ